METLDPMANFYMADWKEDKEQSKEGQNHESTNTFTNFVNGVSGNGQKHSREVHTTNVDIKYGIKAMRVLAVIIYVLVGIAFFVSLVLAADKHSYESLPFVVIGGSIIPISIGLILRKVADIAEYISDKVK